MSKKNESSVIQRKGGFYLRKTFEGKQREISLGTDSKVAKSRANRFLVTAESSGFEVAMAELRKKPYVKAGANPDYEEIAMLYKDFCRQSVNPPRAQTIAHNLARLKCVMSRCEFKTVGKIDKSLIAKRWNGEKSLANINNRTLASAISAAAGVFKKKALDYYKSRGVPVSNPFTGMELKKSKVSPYSPLSSEQRDKIWNDCQTELDAPNAMIVLMALGIGMRRSEIEAALPSWFSKQPEKVLVTIREEKHFQTKNGEDGQIPVAIHLYETLLRLRGDNKSPYFVFSESPKLGVGRIWERVKIVNSWLKGKGLVDRKPLHALRKEFGSSVAQSKGILEASKLLRNTPQVCAIHYAGISELTTVDIGAKSQPPKDPISQLAEEWGVSFEEMTKRIKGK